MTLDALIMFAGAFVALLPFLGIPSRWDSALLVLVGIFVIILGIVVRRRKGVMSAPIRNAGTFTESTPHSASHPHEEERVQ